MVEPILVAGMSCGLPPSPWNATAAGALLASVLGRRQGAGWVAPLLSARAPAPPGTGRWVRPPLASAEPSFHLSPFFMPPHLQVATLNSSSPVPIPCTKILLLAKEIASPFRSFTLRSPCPSAPFVLRQPLLAAASPSCSTCYQTGRQEQKEQPISIIGHGRASRQGVYVSDPAFPHGADTNTILMGHEHIAHTKICMADDSPNVRRSCQEPGCNDIVDGTVLYCNNHSGRRPCQQLSQLQSACKSSDLCISSVKGSKCIEPGSTTVLSCVEQGVHIKYEGDDRYKLKVSSGKTQIFRGADRLWKHENCRKQAQGNTVYCKLHNGVTKMVRGCTKSAHGGTPLCIGHGGGKRCIVPGCPNAACGQGRIDRYVRHGGGKRCRFEGCGKGAQGNTDFCIRHGGGRRCKSEGCTKSAQGRTDFCIRHGGGSRCKFQGCSTSAKWGSDFCSVHRKSLFSGENTTPEALPAKNYRAKKPKKAAKPLQFSQGTVTIAAATAGSNTQEIGILRAATMVPNHDLSSNITIARKPVVSPHVVVPLSMKSPTPSEPVVSAGTEAATNQGMLGL